MELILKCCAAAILCAAACLLIKKANPELSFALGAAGSAIILIAALKLSDGIGELMQSAKALIGPVSAEIAPMLKCVGIAAVTKFTSELCRDASQSAAAGSIEAAGTICAAAVSAPLIISMLKLIGDMV